MSWLLLCATGVRAADDPTQLRRIVDDAVRPLMAQHAVPGMAVAVTVNGQSAVFNYGLASREDGTPVDDHTLFEVGSVSKTFTATLAAYAQAQGRLSLSDRPSRYLPALAGSPVDRATLLHLGTYTAGGLPLQLPEAVADHDRMLAYFRQWKPDAAPGTQRRYSNPSIGLFGYVAAQALQMDFALALESGLLRPLGLKDTYIRVPPRAMADYAWGYSKEDKPIRVTPGLFDAQAYGIKATAADLLRFVQANIAPASLPPPVRTAIAATHVGYFQVGDLVQGLGWEQFPYPLALERLLAGNARDMMLEPNAATPLMPPRPPARPALFSKTGSTNGFGAYVAFVPDRKIGIVMLANRNLPIPARLRAAHAVLEQLATVAQSHGGYPQKSWTSLWISPG